MRPDAGVIEADLGLPRLDGVRHRFVGVDGVRLHVAEAGEGPPLLLLHGWPQHWWCWRHLIPRLARSRRVLAPDLRGWGWSEAPPGRYDKGTWVQDIVGLLDAEGIDRVEIIGHDWGGLVAFLLALEHPERVARAVNLDIAPPWLPRPRARHLALPALSTYALLVAAPFVGSRLMTSSNQFIRGVIRAGSADHAWREADLDVYASVLREPARARASSACYRTFLTRELPALAARNYRPHDLDVETLLLMGAESPLCRVIDPQPAPSVRVVRVAGAGHFLPEEAPERVLELATEFLESAPRS